MIRIAVLMPLILSSTFAQYNRPSYQRPHEEPAPEPEQYYPRPRRQEDLFNPASVHYVNIGTKLEGDYKFGYDTGKRNDGQSFREETRLPDGTVQGAYGYVDGDGRQRIVKYTAGKDGYKAEGDIGPEGAPRRTAPAAPPAPAPQNPPQSYAPQQSYQPPPQQSYQPPQQQYTPPVSQRQPQPVYRHEQPQRSYDPPPRRPSEDEYDSRSRYYDNSNNEINGRPINIPLDTTLFNYNIGSSRQSRS